jgi:hypothetical protein
MRIFHALLGIVLFLALLAGCLFLLAKALSGDDWGAWLELLKARAVEAVIVATAVLLVTVLYLLSGVPVREKEKYLAYDGEGGSVSISLKAVEDLVSRLAGEFAAVVSLEPDVRPREQGLDVDVDVKVRAGSPIPELCKMLQARVKEVITQKAGIATVREVRVRVTGLASDAPAPAARGPEVRPGPAVRT